MEKAITLNQNTYQKLLGELNVIISEGKQRAEAAVEREKAITYWRMGEIINKHLLEQNERAEYGKRLFFRLAEDLNISRRLLYQIVQFYETFPIVHARAQLEWSHYRILMSVEDKEQRKTLEKQAGKLNWTTRELEEVIKTGNIPESESETVTPEPIEEATITELNATRGMLYTYRLQPNDYIGCDENSVAVDLGFYICIKIPRAGIAPAKGGEIIQSEKNGENFSLKYSNAKKSEIYTYKALIEKVVDGDTLAVKIDCGFNTWIHQRLRLRGIDCPELTTPQGQKAKRFVEDAFKGLDFIIIKTYSSDKYDRYLTDIFYLSSTVTQKVMEKGKFLNQELLNLGLAKPFTC